jgi:RNA-binding protein 8A
MALTTAVEGWIVMASNLNEEASEEDVTDFFSDFGTVRNLHLNLDRRTGYVKGYALIEFATYAEAEKAVKNGRGMILLDRKIDINFAFEDFEDAERSRDAHQPLARSRSRSPSRRSTSVD